MNIPDLRVLPEVTKTECLSAAMLFFDGEKTEAKKVAIMSEIIGCACTIDCPEMLRRFIVWETKNGPIKEVE